MFFTTPASSHNLLSIHKMHSISRVATVIKIEWQITTTLNVVHWCPLTSLLLNMIPKHSHPVVQFGTNLKILLQQISGSSMCNHSQTAIPLFNYRKMYQDGDYAEK